MATIDHAKETWADFAKFLDDPDGFMSEAKEKDKEGMAKWHTSITTGSPEDMKKALWSGGVIALCKKAGVPLPEKEDREKLGKYVSPTVAWLRVRYWAPPIRPRPIRSHASPPLKPTRHLPTVPGALPPALTAMRPPAIPPRFSRAFCLAGT